MNNNRRSLRLQAEHKNVWCSNPGSVVGSAGTASINSISALHTRHRIAVSPSPIGGWCAGRWCPRQLDTTRVRKPGRSITPPARLRPELLEFFRHAQMLLEMGQRLPRPALEIGVVATLG